MPWRFHRVLNIIPGLVRLNLSKGGLSGSVGPRGADVNIGKQGVTTNAGIPGTGLSYRQKLGAAHGSGIGVGLFIAGLAFAGWKHYGGELKNVLPSMASPGATQQVADDDSGGIPTVTHETKGVSRSHSHTRVANAGADVVEAAKPASGVMYVHRNNSDLRPSPSTSSDPIKKLAKGEQVTLIAVSDKWSEVQDGALKGWVRTSIIKDTPPN